VKANTMPPPKRWLFPEFPTDAAGDEFEDFCCDLSACLLRGTFSNHGQIKGLRHWGQSVRPGDTLKKLRKRKATTQDGSGLASRVVVSAASRFIPATIWFSLPNSPACALGPRNRYWTPVRTTTTAPGETRWIFRGRRGRKLRCASPIPMDVLTKQTVVLQHS